MDIEKVIKCLERLAERYFDDSDYSHIGYAERQALLTAINLLKNNQTEVN